ncbi:hypothetical protein JWJ90_13220 [Desulfobulbus rhabdoformis]|uniref:hypothetical protein n=1 Tax=Desulfobulbus rhabdoformis TaxID=34032 RepID=UPI0019662A4B|nr:hypothetical protein [Desulfobulbus rhabdoformis]MBM9615240.1 hypothetical protein [Desulfobulbus rhabdoformis]
MDRYQKENAARRVLEYFYPRAHERSDQDQTAVFNRAKAETIKIIEQALAEVQALEQDDFFTLLKAGKIQKIEFWPWNNQNRGNRP